MVAHHLLEAFPRTCMHMLQCMIRISSHLHLRSCHHMHRAPTMDTMTLLWLQLQHLLQLQFTTSTWQAMLLQLHLLVCQSRRLLHPMHSFLQQAHRAHPPLSCSLPCLARRHFRLHRCPAHFPMQALCCRRLLQHCLQLLQHCLCHLCLRRSWAPVRALPFLHQRARPRRLCLSLKLRQRYWR